MLKVLQKTVLNMSVGKLQKNQNSYNQKGVTYLWMLFLVFLIGLGLGKSLEIVATVEKRQKEQQLLYVGGLYREAIKQYYSSGVQDKKYPPRLDDLLKDPRSIVVRRYIRQLYVDPVSNDEFDLIYAQEGGICGVKSKSKLTPLRQSFEQSPAYIQTFKLAKHYSQWEFKYEC